MTDDRDHTGRRPRLPTHDAHGAESAEARRLERERIDRALASAAREQFDQLLTGDDTAPDPSVPRPAVGEEITGVHELERRVQAALQDFDARDVRIARAVTRVVGQHVATERLRKANRDLVIAAGGAPDVELAGRVKAIEEWRNKLTGADERNGRIGRLEADVRSTRRWYRAAVALAALLLSAAAGGGKVILDKMDARAREEGRVQEWRRQIELRLDAITVARRRTGAFSPDTPADGDVP